jgi:hypothetical protein
VYENEQLANDKDAYNQCLPAAGMTFVMAAWGGRGNNKLNCYQ